MVINCSFCGERICNRSAEFQACGAFTVDIGGRDDEVSKDICRRCAKEITKEVFEEMVDEF